LVQVGVAVSTWVCVGPKSSAVGEIETPVSRFGAIDTEAGAELAEAPSRVAFAQKDTRPVVQAEVNRTADPVVALSVPSTEGDMAHENVVPAAQVATLQIGVAFR
jgi:hypothetical protein